jgi:hypothetical protein
MLRRRCGSLCLVPNKPCRRVDLGYCVDILRVPTHEFLLYLREECAHEIHAALFFGDVFHLAPQCVESSQKDVRVLIMPLSEPF